MKRLIPIILAAIMASFPPSLMLVLIGAGVFSAGGGGVPRVPGVAASSTSTASTAAIHGVMMTAATMASNSASTSSLPMATVVSVASVTSMASITGVSASSGATSSAGGSNANGIQPNSGNSPDVADPSSAQPETFKVTVLGHAKGSSPSCTFSLVEFTNLHPSDNIVIHSAHIEPSAVFPDGHVIVEGASQQVPPPQFFHDDYSLERKLHLPPGSATTIPVSVFPHWRKYHGATSYHRFHSPLSPKSEPPPPSSPLSSLASPPDEQLLGSMFSMSLCGAYESRNASSVNSCERNEAIRKDFADIAKDAWGHRYAASSEPIDQAIHPAYQLPLSEERRIHETLSANTSWGFLQMKVPYVCSPSSPEYEYGLPNNLVFVDGGGGWYARRNTTPTTDEGDLFLGETDSEQPFIYNIFMNNPSMEDEIQIWEVFTTKTNVVRVEINPSRKESYLSSDETTFYPLLNSHWKIPPGENNFYVASIRLLHDHISWSMLSSPQDLGFFVVRTSVGSFSIGLDFLPNSGRNGVVHGARSVNTVGNIRIVRDNILNVMASKVLMDAGNSNRSESPLSIVKTYHASNKVQAVTTQQMQEQLEQQQRVEAYDPEWDDFVDTIVSTSPQRVNFGIFTAGSRLIRVPINVINHSDKPLRLMHISVTLEKTFEDNDNITEAANIDHRLDVGVDFSGVQMMHLSTNERDGKETLEFPHEMVLPPQSVFKYPINIWCKFIVSPEQTAYSYSGHVVMRVSEKTNITYHEWEQELLSESLWEQDYVTDIPFRGAILPGNFGVSTDSLLFPTHFSMLPPNDSKTKKQRTNGKNPEYYDRELEITNNFGVPISITKMFIGDAGNDRGFCKKHFSIPSFGRGRDGEWPRADKDGSWKELNVRFKFQPNDNHFGPAPQKCILSLETDKVGKQSLPLIVYSGELIVDMELPDGGMLNKDCLTTKDGAVITTTGMPCVHDWIENTQEGGVLKDAILELHRAKRKKKSKSRSCSTKGSEPVESYFNSLLSGPSEYLTMHPIIMPFGAIGAGNVVTRSIFLTNLNHAAVEVTASSSALDNMDLSIGITQGMMLDSLKQLNTEQKEDIAYFLTHSPSALNFFSKMKYQADISLSPRANGNELKSLFGRQALMHTFQNKSVFRESHLIGLEHEDLECSCGFVLSTDGAYIDDMTSRKSSTKSWVIPPGGVARFTITLLAPDVSRLKNDVTSFVATGLVFETNHGQAMPIVLTYSALVGQLMLKPPHVMYQIDGLHSSENPSPSEQLSPKNDAMPLKIQIPLSIRDPLSMTSYSDRSGEHEGVPLWLESTFSQDIYLKEIWSCNKWFEVRLSSSNSTERSQSISAAQTLLTVQNNNEQRSSMHSPTKIPIGEVHSAMTCSYSSNSNNFFSCALEWLERSDTVQPPGCGLPILQSFSQEFVESKLIVIKNDAIAALRDVVSFLSGRYSVDLNSSQDQQVSKSTDQAGENIAHERDHRYVPYPFIEMFDKARKAWGDIEAIGLNVVTGHIRAKTAYVAPHRGVKSGENHESHPLQLSIPVSSILLQSALEIPQLFNGDQVDSVRVLEFDTVHVAQTASLYVPISNPSGTSIRVKLSACFDDGSDPNAKEGNVFVQKKPGDVHPWWTGGSYWMSDDEGKLISASHNVTIKSGAGAFVSLVNPALHSISAFVLGCGRRCGLRNEGSDSGGEEKQYSPIGSASGDGTTLIGRPHDGTLPRGLNTPQGILGMIDPPAFSIGRTGISEIVIPPFGNAELGPIHFRPPSRGDFNSSIYIENSLSGFERLEIRGKGGWESLVFLDQSDESDDGGDVEFRHGRSALVFPGSAPPDHKPVVKGVVVSNDGDFAMDISKIYMASSEIKHFTHKRPHPTLYFRRNFFGIFSRASTSSDFVAKCSTRKFNLLGCDDVPHNSWLQLFLTWFDSMRYFFNTVRPSSKLLHGDNIHNKENLNDGFTLLPHENKTLFIEHRPDCAFQTSYASLILEIRDRNHISSTRRHADSWQQTFRKDKVELLVGYDMSDDEIKHCAPYAPPSRNFFRKINSLSLSNMFGLSGSTDSNRKSQPSTEATLSFITFLFLLMLLAFDLFVALGVPAGILKEGSKWKSTCRCLARADPTSPDLVALGKEQTKHVVLSRFKREGVLPTHCILPDGSFSRERIGMNVNAAHSKVVVDGNPTPHRRFSHVSQHAKTLSEAIFHQHNLVDDSTSSEDNIPDDLGLLPCGLGWRTAMRRGIGSSQSSSNDSRFSPGLKYFARTSQLRRKQLQNKPIYQSNGTISLNSNNAVLSSATMKESLVTNRSTVLTKKEGSGQPQDKIVVAKGKTKSAAPLPATPPAKYSNGKKNTDSMPAQPQPKTPVIVSSSNNTSKATTLEKLSKNKSKEESQALSSQPSSNEKAVHIQSEQNPKTPDSKGKLKMRNEAKQVKKDRVLRSESKKSPAKEDSASKGGKGKSNHKIDTPKIAVDHFILESRNNGKNDEKEQKDLDTAPRQNIEVLAIPAKYPKQTRKGNNGSKHSDVPKAKQQKHSRQKLKHERGSEQIVAKHPQTPNSTSSSVKEQPSSLHTGYQYLDQAPSQPILTQQPDIDFPPLSSVPQSPLSDTSYKASASTPHTPSSKNIHVRPPPGLAPPPGFMGETAADAPSSPNRTVLNTPRPESIPGMELSESSLLQMQTDCIPSPPITNLLTESALFPTHLSLNSRQTSENSAHVSALLPPSLTPPILDSNDSEYHSEAPDVQSLLGAGSNFNVTNFLDGILSESTQPQIKESDAHENATAIDSLSRLSTSAGVPLDPWNSSANSSPTDDPLAAIIGRMSSIEGSALHGQVEHNETVIAGIPLSSDAPPLLSPSTFHSAGAHGELAHASIVPEAEQGGDFLLANVISGVPIKSSATSRLATAGTFAEPAYASLVSETEEESDTFLEPDSFYSQLLGED